MDLVELSAHDGNGTIEPRFLEPLAKVRTSLDMAHAPLIEDAGESGVGIVVDDDDFGAAEMELLHRAQPDPLEATHDDVAGQFLERMVSHLDMLPSGAVAQVAAPLNLHVNRSDTFHEWVAWGRRR